MQEMSRSDLRRKVFLRALAQDNLNHAYIFAGPNGTGKIGTAKWLGQAIFCEQRELGEPPCLVCRNCQRIADNDFPDVNRLATEATSISVDDIRELVRDMSRTAYEGSQKLFIIEEADKMTIAAQNSLLKFLEEPTVGTTILLLTNAPNKLLATIQSRCQQVDFLAENEASRYQQLVAAGIPENRAVILKSLTQDVEQAKDLYHQEEVRNLLECFSQFYLDLRDRKETTFVYIQTHLMPLLPDRQTQSLGLDIFLAYYRVGLHQAYYDERGQEKGVQLANDIKIVLEGIQKFQSYVPMQSVLESICLAILAS